MHWHQISQKDALAGLGDVMDIQKRQCETLIGAYKHHLTKLRDLKLDAFVFGMITCFASTSCSHFPAKLDGNSYCNYLVAHIIQPKVRVVILPIGLLVPILSDVVV
jgi:hypothetical protein